MLTLSFGYKKPQSGDKGSVWFPAMEANMQQLNDHNHNGANSAQLTAASVTAVSQAILAAAWVAQGGGTYKQTVTMTPGLTYDNYQPNMRLTSTKELVYAKVVRVSATTYDVYVNDNTLNLTAVYTS